MGGEEITSLINKRFNNGKPPPPFIDMENREKILEQFHYFNIQADIDSVYGNWVVSKNGDVVNSVYPYAILSIHVKEIDWLKKMKSKVWFKSECENALSKALLRANEILE